MKRKLYSISYILLLLQILASLAFFDFILRAYEIPEKVVGLYNILFYALIVNILLVILSLSSFFVFLKIKNGDESENLENMALTDSLTGLYNRRYFDSFYENIFAQSSRYGTSFSLIMCDIDHFKKINDTYGHDSGDVILKMVSDTLMNNIRKSDIVARFGGEEFMICLPFTPIEDAMDVARKVKMMISKVNLMDSSNKGNDIKKVTISMGVISFKSDFKEKPKELIKHLDNLLYEAKNRGRNRIISEDLNGEIIEVEENPWTEEES